MRKRLLILFGVLVLLLGGGLAVVLLVPSSPINRANFEKIRPGMPKAEVEQVLGGPAVHYSPGAQGFWVKLQLPQGFSLRRELEEELESGLWQGDEAIIVVCFDESGQVLVTHFRERHRESLLNKVRRWFGV